MSTSGRGRALVVTSLMALCALGIALLQPGLAANVHKLRQRDDVFLLPPPAQLRAMTLGYRAAATDLVWAKLILEYGIHGSEKRPFPDVTRYIDGILALEPDFPTLYQFVDTILVFTAPPGGTADDARTARRYLERGTRERPYDADTWMHCGQFVAFLGPSFLKDEAEIQRWRLDGAITIAHAVELGSDAQRSLAASSILTKAGERKATIEHLQRAYAMTDDAAMREQFLLKLRVLQGDALAEQSITVVDRELRQGYRFLSRGTGLLIGPSRPVAACAGPSSYDQRGCGADWERVVSDFEVKRAWQRAWPIAVPALVALVVYARAAWLGLTWDDAVLVADNPSLGSLRGLVRIWTEDAWKATGLDEASRYYRPVAMTSFWLVAWLSRAAAAHHVTSVVLHALNAALVARVLTKRAAAEPLTACLAASFWAVATASSEAVLWISGRFDVLVTTFLLAALLANGGRRRWLAALCFAAALLTKEVAFAWFPVLVVDDLALQRRAWRSSWRHWAMLLGSCVAVLLVRRAAGVGGDGHAGDALGWAAPAFATIAARVVARLFVPVGLDPLQPLSLVSAPVTAAILVALAALVAFVAAGARRSRAAGSPWSVGLVGAAWFALALVPMCAIAPSEPVAGDRYGYAASVGIVLALVGAGAGAAGAAADGPRLRAAHIAFGALALVQAALTVRHIPTWTDRASVATEMARVHPESAHAHYLLGMLALERRDVEEADRQLARSLALGRTWRALDAACVLELRRNRLDVAEQYCLASAREGPTNPRVWLNLASVHVRAKRWGPALESAEHALALKPRFVEARELAAVSAGNLGLLPAAAAHVEAGLAVDPGNARLLALKGAIERQRAAPAPTPEPEPPAEP